MLNLDTHETKLKCPKCGKGPMVRSLEGKGANDSVECKDCKWKSTLRSWRAEKEKKLGSGV